jgi:ubiquinone biosynthesis protein COQ9
MFPRSRIVSLSAVAGRRAIMARPLAHRSMSTATAAPSSSTPNPSPPSPSMQQHKQELLHAALKQVHEHGWTQKAITAAVLKHPQNNWSLSMAGMITPSDLVSYCMDDWNRQLASKINQQQPVNEFEAIQFRLQCEIPWIQSGRWHQAMAMGMMQQPFTTRQQLHALVETIAPHATMARQAALGATYVATELHMLTDTSLNYQATWEFLKQRLETLDHVGGDGGNSMLLPSVGGLPADAVNAVAMSLLEGATSLFLPTTSTVVGTKVSDYKK